jgi:hypothetical protein
MFIKSSMEKSETKQEVTMTKRQSRFHRMFPYIICTVALIIGPIGSVTAQNQAVSDTELETFSEVYQDIESIQTELQDNIDTAIKDSGLSEERFYEIYQGMQHGSEASDGSGLNEEEKAQYETALSDIGDVQQEAQDEMVALLNDAGMEVHRFNEILQNIQNDQELMERFTEKME